MFPGQMILITRLMFDGNGNDINYDLNSLATEASV